VIEELEWQLAIHGLDPERHTTEFNRQVVDINAVQAAFHHVPPQTGRQPFLSVRLGGWNGYGFVGYSFGFPAVGDAADPFARRFSTQS